jgi:UDP:flavonoid glycosyltransferase YjiC (YdhE family)
MTLSALSDLPVTVLAVTAGRIDLAGAPANAVLADYVPLADAVRGASLVICNGGSLTTYQALDAGVPVLGVCSNMDQLLNMSGIERLGAGLLRRAARVRPADLGAVVRDLLGTPSYMQAAKAAGERFAQVDAGQRFRAFVSEIVDSSTSATGR